MDCLIEGKKVFDLEILALEKTRDALDDKFCAIVNLITSCKGKVIITGIGKPGHIAVKIAATFSSLGIPSFRLHPAEALHGDLGMVSKEDIVIAISCSGESDEIVRIIPNIKLIGAILIGITENGNSTLAHYSDIVQLLPVLDEACKMGLAPTSSTTAFLCYGDALAVVASEINNFDDTDFGKLHPSGALGRKLVLRVEDLMADGSDNAIISLEATLKEAIVELSKKGLGIVSVVDKKNQLLGVITDGDLRRQLEKGVDVYRLSVLNVMSSNPVTISLGELAITALKVMRDCNISNLPVVESNKLVGTIRMNSIITAGIV